MPQFQVLQPNPGFGSQLGQSLGSGLGQGFQQGVGQYFEQKKNKSALEGLRPIFKELGIEGADFDTLKNSGIDPKIVGAIAGQMGQRLAKEKETFRNDEKIKQEKIDTQDELQGVFDELSDSLIEKKPGIGWSLKPFLGNDEALENRGKFKALSGSLEGALLPLVNKGALSQKRFDYIIGLIPDGTERVATQKGKLKGLAKTLSRQGIKLNVDRLEEAANPREEKGNVGGKQSSFQKVAAGTPITPDIIDRLLDQTKNDPKKAKELARKMGYKVE